MSSADPRAQRQDGTARPRYRGRSFDEVFADSYASAPIGKATDEQLRMALLAADQKLVKPADRSSCSATAIIRTAAAACVASGDGAVRPR
jgi:hypothetical protein